MMAVTIQALVVRLAYSFGTSQLLVQSILTGFLMHGAVFTGKGFEDDVSADY